VKNPRRWLEEIQEMTRKPVILTEWETLVYQIQMDAFAAGVDSDRKRIRDASEALPAGDSMGIGRGMRTLLKVVAADDVPYPPMEYDNEL
jgi:hypothetical protein